MAKIHQSFITKLTKRLGEVYFKLLGDIYIVTQKENLCYISQIS